MNLPQRLALALLNDFPADGARTVETLQPDLQSEVLSALDPHKAAAVVILLAPHVGAAALEAMSSSEAAAIVISLPTSAAAALLRRLPEEQKAALIAQIPDERRAGLSMMLAQNEGTVGVLADPDVVALPAAITRSEAVAVYTTALLEATYEIPVVGPEGRLVGVVSLRALLQSADSARVDAIMVAGAPSLPARRSAASAFESEAWDGRPSLPVVNSAGAFVGILRHETLRLVIRGYGSDQRTNVSTARALGEVFGVGVGGMLEAIVSAVSDGETR